MGLKVHHLSCGSMCPYCQPLVHGTGSWLKAGKLVCHCLLIETSAGLVLVDTGFGTQDIAHPTHLGTAFRLLLRPQLSPESTALAQIKNLGFEPSDVRHIIMTHLDLDHAGGIPDFPNAQVHVYAPEYEAATRPTPKEKSRYVYAQFDTANI